MNSVLKLLATIAMTAAVAACSSNQATDEGSAGSGTDAYGSGTSIADDGTASIGVGSDGGLTADEMAARSGLQYVFYFEFDQSALDPETRAALDAQAAVLRGTGRTVRLEGHADERGSREYNLALGERRANAIANYLVLQGIDRSLIETVSYGEERPAVLGSDEAALQRNRRVELK